MRKPASVWIGYDKRETEAFIVARESINRRLNAPIPSYGLRLSDVQRAGLYTREVEVRAGGQLWDPISGAGMSTEFAISRFLVPHLARQRMRFAPYGWALFMDCDMLVRDNLAKLFRLANEDYAVMCVKHTQESGVSEKMNGLQQTYYARKNWSSVLLFNVDHPANKKLTLEMINTLPGRDLHALCWLEDHQIGELQLEWNWLADVSPAVENPKIVHHTLGSPAIPGYEKAPYADEWNEVFARWINMA